MKILAIIILSLSLVGCGFSKQTRDYTQVITTATHDILAINSGVIEWMKSVLIAARLDGLTHIKAENPNFDVSKVDPATGEPLEPEFILLPIDEVIDGLTNLQERNEILAEGTSILNLSVQSNRGLDPVFEDVQDLLSDPEVIALLNVYLAKKLEKRVTE
jgi:hypothetical protein